MTIVSFKKNRPSSDLVAIEEITGIVDNVITGFVVRKAIPSREKEDIAQEVIRKYLEKKDKINEAYKGDANPRTYLTAIFYRMCCELIRSGYKNWDHIQKEDPSEKIGSLLASSATDNRFIIRNEAQYLQRILELFDDEKAKIILFLKVLYGLTITDTDIAAYNENYKTMVLDNELFNRKPTSNQELFKSLGKLVNLTEKKDIKPDAVRIWLYNRIDQIVKRLNGSMNRANYDRKTFQLLFEYVFDEEH